MEKEQEIDNFLYLVSVKEIQKREVYKFNLIADKGQLRFITKTLKLLEIKRAKIQGLLKLKQKDEIFLDAIVSAKLIQPCSITLQPVIINIEKNVSRKFFIRSPKTDLNKIQTVNLSKESFDTETVDNTFNLADILIETISLETPDYPKSYGASLSDLTFDQGAFKNNPFSILEKLKKNL